MDADPEVKLQREVEIPRSKSGGAAVVVVAFCALFMALGSSALMVRVRMSGCPAAHRNAAQVPAVASVAETTPAAPAAAATPVDGRMVVPVELVSAHDAQIAAERALDDADRELLAAFRLTAARDPEAALDMYNQLPDTGATRHLLADEHETLADDWLATQVSRLEHEMDRHDCGAVDERLQRMHRLLPERRMPVAMDGCSR